MIKKIIGISAIVFVGFIAFCIYALVWQGSTKEIVGVADSLRVPSDWELTRERVTPPRIICMGDSVCPSLGRWYSAVNIDSAKDMIRTLLPEDAKEISYDPQCGSSESNIHSGQSYTDCTASQKRDGFETIIYIERVKGQKDKSANVSIFVEEVK